MVARVLLRLPEQAARLVLLAAAACLRCGGGAPRPTAPSAPSDAAWTSEAGLVAADINPTDRLS